MKDEAKFHLGQVIKIDATQYNIKKVKFPDGQVQITMQPIKCNCRGCNKRIDWDGANSVRWTDDDGYKREGRFCRVCHSELKKRGITFR